MNAYIVGLTKTGNIFFKVAILATDIDGVKLQIAQKYPDHDWIVHKDEIYPVE